MLTWQHYAQGWQPPASRQWLESHALVNDLKAISGHQHSEPTLSTILPHAATTARLHTPKRKNNQLSSANKPASQAPQL
jgi:hypothetical protein